MGALYSSPRNYVQTRVLAFVGPSGPVFQGGGSKTWAITVKSAILIDVENYLNNTQNLCIEGRPQDPEWYHQAWTALGASRLLTYPDSSPEADGPLDAIVEEAYGIFYNTIQATPVDMSLRINAGTVLSKLGQIPWKDGSLDLSGYPAGVNG